MSSTNLVQDQNIPATTRAYIWLISIFLGVLLITNIITAKYIHIGPITLTAGVITYPLAFTLIDVIAEIYGNKRAKWAVWMGLAASLFMGLVLQAASAMPAHSHSIVSQHNFELMFGFVPGILIASIVACLVAQLMDIFLFGYIAKLTHRKHLWLRNTASTLISQLIDTTLFGWIAWIAWPLLNSNQAIEPLPWHIWYQLTCNEYLFKIIFTLFNIPLVYLGVYVIRRSTLTT
jgi:uncharacterized integral membrane protein (TIGR00697 family)